MGTVCDAASNCHSTEDVQTASVRVLTGLLHLAQNIERPKGDYINSDLRITKVLAPKLPCNRLLQFRLRETGTLNGPSQRERKRPGIVDLVFARKPILAENSNTQLVAGGEAELNGRSCQLFAYIRTESSAGCNRK